MDVEYHFTGIYLPRLDLWLDSRVPVATSWISHAHSDHACGGHGEILTSAQTMRFLELRDDLAQRQAARLLPDREWIPFRNGARLMSIPCAHICGARQLLIEHGGERFIYTGDIKLRDSILGESTHIEPCHHLVIESTFGLPIFRFLDAEVAKERIASFADRCLRRGETPVFFGYGLGRGQEIVHTLGNAGITSLVHGAIARLIPAHEEEGYRFPLWEPYVSANGEFKGRALVVTPGFRDFLQASSRANCRFAYVSGWAGLSRARAQMDVEELIPYSDHADFNELVQLVAATGARRVDVVHGYTEAFASVLRERCQIDARAAGAGTKAEEEH